MTGCHLKIPIHNSVKRYVSNRLLSCSPKASFHDPSSHFYLLASITFSLSRASQAILYNPRPNSSKGQGLDRGKALRKKRAPSFKLWLGVQWVP